MRLRAALISLSKQGHDYSPCADALEEAGLKTSDDLLFTTSTSEQYARLPGGTLSFPEFAALKEDVSKFVAPHPLTGEEAYLLAMGTEAQRYEGLCGVPELDALLGGFGQYGVLEFSGGRESCKTLLAFHIVLRYLSSERKGKALWIDTSNSFNVQRALAVTRLLPGLGVGDALDRLAYSTCFDVDPALGVLDDIRQSIDLRGERVDTTTPRFIVIDAITPLLSKEISSVSSQGHAIMVSFLRQLNALARSYSLTVLIINNSVLAGRPKQSPNSESEANPQPALAIGMRHPEPEPHNELSAFSTTSTRPALGPTFTFLSDATLWLSEAKMVFPADTELARAGQQKVYIAEVLRSRSTLSGTWCAFKSDGLNLLPI